MALTAGSLTISGSARITGASIAPQGTASTSTIAPPATSVSGSDSMTLAFGTAAGQANIYCAGDFTLAAGASVTLDLYTGTDFKDVQGGTAAFRKIKAVELHVVSGGDAAGVTVGNAASDGTPLFFGAAANTWTVYPSGPPLLGGNTAGITVGTGTKNLRLLNNGAVSVTVRLLLAGTSV